MSRIIAGAAAALLLMASTAAYSADEPIETGPWKFGAVTGLNLSQSAFSDNWAGGDKGAINRVASADLSADRQVSQKLHWGNKLELAFGETSTQEPTADGEKSWSRPDKTTDRIFFESLGRLTLGGFVDPYVSGQLESQFLDESQAAGKLTLNPLKLTESGGVARVFHSDETSELQSRLGFGLRPSIARPFTDDTGETTESFTTTDGGIEFQTDMKQPVLDDKVLYQGRLKVFLPLFSSQSSDLEDFDTRVLADVDAGAEEIGDFWKAPDVDFLNTFSAEITSWMSVNLLIQWAYDKFDAATNVDLSNWDDVDPAKRDAILSEIYGGVRKSGQ
ncbi:MAG: DUF3078 domain-containing protein, partial [Phycisphaeraceae bacterium]|nr:DUF3078 domain-containing protein [Phycisphaeraceae bacterium]